MPEFYMIFARKNIFPIFEGGGESPSPMPMDETGIADLHDTRTRNQRQKYGVDLWRRDFCHV